MDGNFPTAVMAELTCLGERPFSASVAILSWESNRLTIQCAFHLVPGALVKVSKEDSLWLGEVLQSSASGTVVIQVVHSLKHLRELSLLADRFMARLPEGDLALPPSPTLAPAPTVS
jgi:hypothetical protein